MLCLSVMHRVFWYFRRCLSVLLPGVSVLSPLAKTQRPEAKCIEDTV
jgi:hypothetical protein